SIYIQSSVRFRQIPVIGIAAAGKKGIVYHVFLLPRHRSVFKPDGKCPSGFQALFQDIGVAVIQSREVYRYSSKSRIRVVRRLDKVAEVFVIVNRVRFSAAEGNGIGYTIQ